MSCTPRKSCIKIKYLKAILPGAPQVKDRVIVAERMKQHVQAADTTPLLIFPEGTCVNNEYCVMFKRGAFDLGATVCPVAIKYNKVFVDAFWNSKRQSFTAHLVSIHGFQGEGEMERYAKHILRLRAKGRIIRD